MGGKDIEVSEFGHSLRVNLFQEHFGLSEDEVSDPLDANFLRKIDENAKVKYWKNKFIIFNKKPPFFNQKQTKK